VGGKCQQKHLLVTVETEGDDPKFASEATFDEVWDCVVAAFSSSGTTGFSFIFKLIARWWLARRGSIPALLLLSISHGRRSVES
jgi:hypothetical protein